MYPAPLLPHCCFNLIGARLQGTGVTPKLKTKQEFVRLVISLYFLREHRHQNKSDKEEYLST